MNPDSAVADYRAAVLSRGGRLLAACVVTALAPAVLLDDRGGRPAADMGSSAPTVAVPPVEALTGDADSWRAVATAAAATCPGLPASVLVAIGHIETRLGQGHTSSAGARGPMQFLPATWAAYGVDGDGDGVADIHNPVDALFGAAKLLCANGGGQRERLRSAVWNYNHSSAYVDEVLELAGLAA